MKSRDTLVRLHRFQVDEKRRQIADIEAMMNDFRRMEKELEQQIVAEQERTGISDVTHYAYPTFAKAAIDRRKNLLRSIEELDGQLQEAREQFEEMYGELKKHELMQEKDADRRRSEADMAEQQEINDIALEMHRRSEAVT